MLSKEHWKAEKIYINEIIRVTYKCNWSCKFCNVFKTNNFWENDVSDKEVIYQILNLFRKYSFLERQNLILSFSGWEPTLNKNLLNYIRLAKKIWIKTVEVQTNWTRLFKQKEYIFDLIDAWLDEIFLAQHSANKLVNMELGCFYGIEDFISWNKYLIENQIDKKICIYLNIVITSKNLYSLYEYISFLIGIWFIKMIPSRDHNDWSVTHKISFWFVQPNWYAELHKEEVLLRFTDLELKEIKRVIELCKENSILPDFHFVCPPLCVLDYPEYNLEYERLKKLESDTINWSINKMNLESYEYLWKEKRKFGECDNCENNKYCLWFYKNWIDFVGEDYTREKIQNYLLRKNYKWLRE